jgi:hypothetical protein
LHHNPWMSLVCITAVTGPSASPVLHYTDKGLTRVPHICVPGNTGTCCSTDNIEVLATPRYLEYRTLSHRSMLHSSVTCLTDFDLWVSFAFVPTRTVRGPCSPQPAWYRPLPTWWHAIGVPAISQLRWLLLRLQHSVTFLVRANYSVRGGEVISRTLHKNGAFYQAGPTDVPSLVLQADHSLTIGANVLLLLPNFTAAVPARFSFIYVTFPYYRLALLPYTQFLYVPFYTTFVLQHTNSPATVNSPPPPLLLLTIVKAADSYSFHSFTSHTLITFLHSGPTRYSYTISSMPHSYKNVLTPFLYFARFFFCIFRLGHG